MMDKCVCACLCRTELISNHGGPVAAVLVSYLPFKSSDTCRPLGRGAKAKPSNGHKKQKRGIDA